MKYQFQKGEGNPRFGKNKGADNPMFGRTGKDNPNLGKKRSEETKMKMRLKKLGNNNPMYGTHCNSAEENGNWAAENVKYSGVHWWVKQRLPKTPLCQICEQVAPYDLANISGEYSRDLSDWQWLCRKCHMESDGRLQKLIEDRIRRSIEEKVRDSFVKDPVTGHLMRKNKI